MLGLRIGRNPHRRGTMSRTTDYRRLLSRGRKAGLTSAELNSALSNRAVSAGERVSGQPDANGFLHGIDERGHMTIYPAVDDTPRE